MTKVSQSSPRAVGPREGSVRTCVGCGARDDRSSTLRLVIDEGRVVASLPSDLAKEPARRGRGAHVHPRAACLKKAPKGLARALRARVDATAEALARDVVSRARETISSAVKSAAALDAMVAFEGPVAEGELLAIASDAPDAISSHGVEDAITKGRAIVLGPKAELGRLLGKSEATAVVVRHPGLAKRILAARAVIDSIGSGFSLEDG